MFDVFRPFSVFLSMYRKLLSRTHFYLDRFSSVCARPCFSTTSSASPRHFDRPAERNYRAVVFRAAPSPNRRTSCRGGGPGARWTHASDRVTPKTKIYPKTINIARTKKIKTTKPLRYHRGVVIIITTIMITIVNRNYNALHREFHGEHRELDPNEIPTLSPETPGCAPRERKREIEREIGEVMRLCCDGGSTVHDLIFRTRFPSKHI